MALPAIKRLQDSLALRLADGDRFALIVARTALAGSKPIETEETLAPLVQGIKNAFEAERGRKRRWWPF